MLPFSLARSGSVSITIGAGGVTNVGNRDTSTLSVGGSSTAATLSGVVAPSAGSTITVQGTGFSGAITVTSSPALNGLSATANAAGNQLVISTTGSLAAMTVGIYTFTVTFDTTPVTLSITLTRYCKGL